MRDFRSLLVWQKGHELVLNVYRATVKYPREELFGLTSQSRRAACSITHNIAEGCGRSTIGDLARFMDIASGSASELDDQLLIGLHLNYLNPTDYEDLKFRVDEVKKMLFSYTQKLRE